MKTTTDGLRDQEGISTETPAMGEPAPKEQRDRSLLVWLAVGLVGFAAGLYLLRAMAGFLRPVLIAVLLCYAIWPLHDWLKRRVRPWLSLLIIGTGLGIVAFALGWMAFANAEQFWNELPKYQARAGKFVDHARDVAGRYLPGLGGPGSKEPPRIPLERIGDYAHEVFGAFANFLAQSALVGLYVLFMMIEAPRFPRAIRRAFPPAQAARIGDTVESINRAVIEYLSVKVKVNLIVAVPATLLMMTFGVEGAVLWGVVTFFARFIPYLGGIVAYALPVASAALQFDGAGRSIFFAVALLMLHVAGEYLIEPYMTGKAVGLSPLVVLLALAFWDMSWGIVGMILAVPLTVILKIAFERLDPTRPLARLLADDEPSG